jgi:hypothetical protein
VSRPAPRSLFLLRHPSSLLPSTVSLFLRQHSSVASASVPGLSALSLRVHIHSSQHPMQPVRASPLRVAASRYMTSSTARQALAPVGATFHQFVVPPLQVPLPPPRGVAVHGTLSASTPRQGRSARLCARGLVAALLLWNRVVSRSAVQLCARIESRRERGICEPW